MLLLCFVNVSLSEESVEPLARCALQTVPTAPQPEMATGIVMRTTERPGSVIVANYRRDRSGDWDVPFEIAGNDADVRLMLVTPDGPLLIKLTIHVDGNSFRQTRENWIDRALDPDTSADETVAVDDTEDASTAEAAGGAEANTEEESEGTTAEVFRPTETFARLQKYATQPGLDVGRDEARWLLAQWSPGPALLELRSEFAIERSRFAPLWIALDGDDNGELSQMEIENALSRIRALDHDEDDWVDTDELTDSPFIDSWTSFPLVTVLNETTDWRRLTHQLRQAIREEESVPPLMQQLLTDVGLESLSQLTPKQLSRLAQVTPQLSLTAELATQTANETGLMITSMTGALSSNSPSLAAAEDRVSLALSQCVVELTAAQRMSDTGWGGQVAIGAVIDGSPLMRNVDADNDHRLSLREIEAISPFVTSLDRDGDGTVKLNEVPVPIRLTVTLGAYAHLVLGQAVASTTQSNSTNTPDAPAWFASMDLNRDGELTAAEFLGTQEQFQQLDLDRNQRVSASEAAKLPE